MRTFFALALDGDTTAAIDRWRTNCLPPFERPVRQDNLHITLVFLGDLDSGKLKEVQRFARDVRVVPFQLHLTSLGYWPRQQIAYLAPASVPAALMELAGELKQLGRRCGIRIGKREHQPHVTLARRCAEPPGAPLMPPDFELAFDSFSLFESLRAKGGVSYREIESWP